MRYVYKVIISLFILANFQSVFASGHHIFLIHGIGDSQQGFGASEVVLSRLLNDSSPNTSFYLESFDYQTGNDELTTVDFAKSFSIFFKEYFKDKPLGKNDKFSILAHSQGGLVTMNWLYHSFKGDEGFTDFKFIKKHMKTFASAATPYGGTEIITLGLLSQRLRQLMQLGVKELEDMYFPSAMISKIKRILLGEDTEFVKFLHSLNILNIVGVVHKLPPLSSSAAKLQDDTTVPVTSASMNFHYLKNHKKYFPGDKISADETKFFKNATVVPVNAAHIAVLFVPGIVKVPSECRVLSDCDHPALKFYLNHFLDKKLPKVEEKIRSFVVKLKLEVTKSSLSYSSRENEFKFNFQSDSFNALKYISNKFFLDSVKETPTSRIYEFYYAGKLPKSKLKKHILNIEINGPTIFHIERDVDFTISPGHQTTIDLNLMSLRDY
ncbi:hypothetical protein [Halobacteriovorax sp.]|uniref:alpha/beta hydrolase n=1 Tax=Halobacteriovorax sp. TaxID=2020862 RepID=UPI00356862DB